MTYKNPNAPASDGQLGLIDKLMIRIPEEQRDAAYKRLSDGLTMALAGQWIDRLRALPLHGDLKKAVEKLRAKQAAGDLDEFRASLLARFDEYGVLSEKQIAAVLGNSKPKADRPKVPAGRYAVEMLVPSSHDHKDVEPEWRLFRVWRGTRNPDIQHVYAVRGTEEGERIRGGDELQALLAIAKDPGEAAIEFGHRTGSCSRCGAELDVNLSRKLGIGPTCIKHWFGRDARLARVRKARQELRDAGIDPNEKFDAVVV